MSDRSSRSALVITATALAVVAGSGVAWVTRHDSPAPAPQRSDSQPAAAVPAETDAPIPVAPPSVPDPASPAEPRPEPAVASPGFDVVRVEPDGQSVVVGTAAPGARVTVLADGDRVAEAEADANGNFVALFSVGQSASPRELTLRSDAAGSSVASKEVVMLLPQAPASGSTEVAATAPQQGSATAPPSAIAATAVVRDTGIDVLPPPGDPAAPRRVTLGAISYGTTGEVRVAGVGTAGAVIRIYVDDRFVREVSVGDDGRWQARLDDVAQGLYRLRIDQLGARGAVTSRVETPFQRDMPPPPRPRATGASAGVAEELTVQPGNNLWTLARTRYGSGVEFTKIYTANRDLIRDPDLIYPGQIFRMPDAGAAPAAPAAVE